MRRYILVSIAFFISAASLVSAQTFSVFNLDATNYPSLIKAQFYAFDAAGKEQSLSASDITVTENGIPVMALTVTCPAPATPVALSSVLVVDVSGSMASGYGPDPNIVLARDAASSWVQGLPLGNSECAVVSFDGSNYFNQDFTTNRAKLLTAISLLTANGSTDYDEALIDPPAGGLQVTSSAKYKRIIIMLTDGLPNQEPGTAAIIAEANRQNCLVYAVTLGMPCPQNLKDISTKTGGKWYENVTTVAQAEAVYKQILLQAQNSAPCTITWQSPPECSTGPRLVHFSWNGQSADLNYTPPSKANAQLQFTPGVLFFRSKTPQQKFDTTVTVTAVNSDFSITNITSTNPAYDINPKSFTIGAGKSMTLTLSYTPADSSYSWSEFDFQSDLCPQKYYASGSFPGHKPSASTLRLLKPNGGEIFPVGIDTVITWTGIPLTDTVTLDYTINDGSSWNTVTTQAVGGSFPWHVPNTPSNQCLARVSQKNLNLKNGWVDCATGQTYWNPYCAADRFDNLYLSAQYEGTLTIGGFTISTGVTNAYIAKYHPDKSVEWVKQITGLPDVNCISTDVQGNIYVAGVFDRQLDFGSSITLSPTGVFPNSTGFLAKYHSDGSIEWAKEFGNSDDAEGSSIAADPSGNIYMSGIFLDSINFDGTKYVSAYHINAFLAKFQSDGTFQWLRFGGNNRYVTANGITIDPSGDVIFTGEYVTPFDFKDTILKGTVSTNHDCYLMKYHPDGKFEWAKSFQGIQWYNNLKSDLAGDIYALNHFTGTADFDAVTLTSNGGNDISIAKYRSDGSLEWVKSAGGAGDEYSDALDVDELGNSYITGNFNQNFTFGSSPLVSKGLANIFILNYLSDGTPNWAKYAGGTSRDNGEGIAITPSGILYNSGYINTPSADFEGDSVGARFDGQVYVWKIGSSDVLQSDTSDALFSIVKPQPLSKDIDMGKILVATTKDSVVTGFINNGGTYSFHVDSIAIIGTDAGEFGLVSGIPPYDISPGASHPVEFDFHPSSVGAKSAQIQIFTQSDTLIQSITGVGILPTISVIGNIIDFGQVPVGTSKDTTVTVAIKNNGGTSVDFNSGLQLGPDKLQFSVQSGNTAFTLAPGGSQNVTLRFNPKFIGRTSGQVGFNYNGTGSPAILYLFGQGIGGLIHISNDSGYAGDRRHIPINLEKVPVTSVQSVTTNYSARIAFDNTLLTADSGVVQKGIGYDTVTISGALGTSNEIGFLSVRAYLANTTVSPLNIVDFNWLDPAGNPVDYDVETQSGTFTLLYACGDSSIRNFMLTGKTPSLISINPNPANGIIHVSIQTTEAGRTRLELVNLLGMTVATISDGELKPGSHSFDFNSSQLSAGSYFLTFTTPTTRRIERVDVEK